MIQSLAKAKTDSLSVHTLPPAMQEFLDSCGIELN